MSYLHHANSTIWDDVNGRGKKENCPSLLGPSEKESSPRGSKIFPEASTCSIKTSLLSLAAQATEPGNRLYFLETPTILKLKWYGLKLTLLHTATDDLKSLLHAQNTIKLSDARQNLSQCPQYQMPLITMTYQSCIGRHSCLSFVNELRWMHTEFN